jgi:hypothetical protein
VKIKSDLVGEKKLYQKQLGSQILTRRNFIDGIKTAVKTQSGYAAARIGISEQFLIYYPVMLYKEKSKTKLRVFEKHLRFHGYLQSGIFPADPGFFLKYTAFVLDKMKHLDCLGMILDPVIGPEIIRFHRIDNKLIYFKDMIPDRSTPSNPQNDYLQYFKDKKVLIVCPFAHFLKKRAEKETFERVWSKIDKEWFNPKTVDSVEFPYGFDKKTAEKYDSSLELFASIEDKIKKKNFDIALIAAGGLTVPIASSVKKFGKIAVSLGGDLQVLFGVKGKRWRSKPRWQRDYFNKWWVDTPARYKPDEPDACSGAYW